MVAYPVRELTESLTSHGTTRLAGSACDLYGVLSITPGLTVWTNGRVLWWRIDGEETSWPAAGIDGAAARLARYARPQ